jgi:sarcosine oxidase
MNRSYDAIVLGLGAMGSATVAHLARRGHRVLGLDAHARGHDQGSSHGRSRIIREAYYEAPQYVPLVQRAYALWRELEQESGRHLLTISGGLSIGRPESEIIAGAVHSARLHGLPFEQLSPREVAARFPGFRLTDEMEAIYEPRAGILQPEACIGAHLDMAARHGAELRHEEPVDRWSVDGGGARVETARGVYQGDRLVIAAGPYSAEVLADLGLPLEVERIVNVHFEPKRPDLFRSEVCPIYLLEVPEGNYYGFPALEGQGLKFGRHKGEVCTPRTIRRAIDEEDVESLRRVLDRYLPGAAGAVKWALTCMYTNTPDRHFIVDRHPAYPERVVYACGFSGHGFKFAAVIGEVLADLAMEGTTRHEVGFLSARRFPE